MHPLEASSLVTKLEELFKGILPAERELLQTLLERFPLKTAEAVIPRYAEETTTFDRAKLRTMLREEHSRQTFRKSETPEWRDARDIETKSMDELFARTSKKRLEGAVEEVRKKYPDVFRFLKTEPLQTNVGKALVYSELTKPKT